jgi:glycosyltransferase involved in cell wall biosynthesis
MAERLKRAYYALPVRGYPWLRERRAAQNIREADRLLTNSRSAQNTLRAAYGIESRVCYLGVDTEKFRPLGVAREAFVLSVGAVHYFKGYRFLITALGQVPAALRPPLLIAANSESSDERAFLEALAKQHQVSLTIVRITDDESLVSLYNRAAAFVYTPIMEPWGLTVVEAMACGAPVVAVAEGGVRESISDGETGLLAPRDIAAFVAALARVLTDESLATQLGAAGVERVKQLFTWERTADNLEQHLLRVIHGHGR